MMMHLNVSDAAIQMFSGGFTVKSSASRDFIGEKRQFPRQPRYRVDFNCIREDSDAIRSFREMTAMWPEPSIRVYNNLLSDIAKKEKYSVALNVFGEMRHLGIAVDAYTMNIVINCCSLLKRMDFAGEIAEAEALFKKILSFKLCDVNDVMILTVVNGLSKAGNSLTARDLLVAFGKTGYEANVRAYNAVLDGLSKHGMLDDALLLLSEMVEKGVSPSIFTYNALIDGYCLRGEMDRGKELFDSMAKAGLKHDIFTYCSLIKGYCKKGNLDEAWRFFHEIPRVGLNHTTVSYSTMIQGLMRENRFADGWKLFEDMEAQQVHPNLHTYTILLDGLCRNQKIDEAFSFLKVIEEKGVNPNIVTYGVLINGLKPNLEIYNMMIDSLYQQGFDGEAKSLISEMKRNGCAPDSVTLNNIIWNLMKRNKVHDAIPFLEKMCNRGFSAHSANMSMLLHELQGEGKDDNLQEMIENVVLKLKM
ncbi:hypothetical protein C2S51_020804 [Perilla frutescens var. frutescens]|nr:hypothetical protein C2S51_020804 [Perilla frutescens var. frutescens]